MSVDYAWPSWLKQTQLPCVICTVCEQPAFVCHGPQLPCMRYSLQVSFMPTLRSDSSPSPTIDPRFSPCEIFKYAHLKFTVYGHKQASKQAYTRTCAMAVTLVWGSLRLAPITASLDHLDYDCVVVAGSVHVLGQCAQVVVSA